MTATLGAALVGAAMVSAQSNSQSGSAAMSTVVYRGCLGPGAGEGNFLLSKAVEKGQKSKDKISLKVTPATDKVKLEPFMLKEVEITGTLGSAPATGASPSLSEGGEALRSLTATKITWKNDYCG